MTERKSNVDVPHRPPAAVPTPSVWFEHRAWFLALVLVVVTFLAYQPAWRAGFIWDDPEHFTANPAMTMPHGLRLIWSSLAISRYYPLTLTTFWVERRLWGLHPMPYHLVNIALHALNGVLVYLVLRRLRIPAPWFAAMLWVLHPVNVESVAWITELKNTQSGFFFFLAVLCFLRFDAGARRHWYGLALLCGLAALLSKPSTVVLPPALLLCVWWERGSWRRMDILRIAPFFILALGMSALTVVEQRGHIQGTGTADWNLGMAERFVMAGQAVWFYTSKTLWPARLTFVYPRWNLDAGSFWSWLPLAGLVAGGALLWRWRRQPWARAGLFGGGFFVLALLPVLGFFDVYYFRFSYVADHFQYLASLGLISLAVSMGTAIGERAGQWGHGLGTVAAALALLVLGVSTWRQAHIYQDVETLWADTLAKNPQCWMAHNNLGTALLQEGEVSNAIGHYQQAVRIKPDYDEAHYNLGMALAQSGRIEEAIAHYQQALRIKPDFAEAHNNLGIALVQTGKIGEAIAHYQQALRIKPDFADAHNDLGVALAQTGRIEEAIAHYEQALRTKPDYAEADNNLGNALAQAGRTPEAIEHLQQALRIKPDYADAHNNLGMALAQTGRLDEAIAHYQRALRIKPDYADAHNNLGVALAQTGRIEDAIAHYQQALRIKPDYVDVHNNLGTALAQTGKIEDAIAHFQQALRFNPDLAEVRYNLGSALAQVGRVPEAIVQYQQALRIKPDFTPARNALARLQAGQ
ncbi:MAG: tetratricopeptide repeat protein [Verrucomicrobiia bacterium]